MVLHFITRTEVYLAMFTVLELDLNGIKTFLSLKMYKWSLWFEYVQLGRVIPQYSWIPYLQIC